ncbi:MAG: SDR family NAD(P)-dependent oxidoreductase [Clostridia bacterium]|nr:SDR family NAD(P)-dependent oxidoreductase [Clostridia bacterium]
MSLKKKTIKWLNKNATSLSDKTILITGANSGIGFKTAEVCLFLGARVIMACRNKERAEEAKKALINEYPQADISILTLDLASFSSIDAFANEIIENKIDINIFVNNAGVFHRPGKKTANGLEEVIGVNYFGVYYLAKKLLPYFESLDHEVDFVTTISMIYKFAKKINYNDFFYDKKYKNIAVYARSKLCLAKLSYYLSQKYKNSNIRIFMTHPGISMTPLGINAYGKIVGNMAKAIKWMFNSPEKSSLSLIYALSHNVSAGTIVGPTKLFGGWGYPKINKTSKKAKTGAEELIEFTEKIIKERI